MIKQTACDKEYRDLFSKLLAFDTPEINESSDLGDDDDVLSENPSLGFVEYENAIEIKHRILKKAFVEKPINAEDHNINIYYPSNLGGGHKKLFRKTDNLSSKFFPEKNRIRNDNSFIYEEYLQTDGFDIKVYTVGSKYAHAEARKSPSLDGKVMRDKNGKEVRFPIIMSPEEKEIARVIVKNFKQQICGFDLLRAKGRSYVCDVNGWSFVKGNMKFYDDCSYEILRIILQQFCPERLKSLPHNEVPKISSKYQMFSRPSEKMEEKHEELRSVVAIFRHGDRTPKQKMKLLVNEPEFLEFFSHEKYIDIKPKQIKLKTPKRLEKLLENVKLILTKHQINPDKDRIDRFGKLVQLKAVLGKGGHFDGIYRKVQMKPVKIDKKETKGSTEYIVTEALLILKWGGELTHAGIQQAQSLGQTFRINVYPSSKGMGLLRLHSTYRHDLKCYSSDEGRCLMTAAAFLQGLLDLEGELPPILNSMVISNEEAQDLLEHSEGESEDIKSIKANISKLLNSTGKLVETYKKIVGSSPTEYMHKLMEKIGTPISCLEEIHSLIMEYTAGLKGVLASDQQTEMYLITKYPDPLSASLVPLNKLIDLEGKKEDAKDNSFDRRMKKIQDLEEEEKQLICGCGNESLQLMFKRWKKLEKDFYSTKLGVYDTTKIPDVSDGIRYDVLHNRILINESRAKLYRCVTQMNEFVTPMEYGFTIKQKVNSAVTITKKLLKKMRRDLLWWDHGHPISRMSREFSEDMASYSMHRLDLAESQGIVNSAWRHVRTRLYFTSASHLYTIFNVLVFGLDSALLGRSVDSTILNELKSINVLEYLTHIIIRLYEDLSLPSDDPKRFRLELAISPGSSFDPLSTTTVDHALPIAPLLCINKKITLDKLKDFFNSMIHMNKESPYSPSLEPSTTPLLLPFEEKKVQI